MLYLTSLWLIFLTGSLYFLEGGHSLILRSNIPFCPFYSPFLFFPPPRVILLESVFLPPLQAGEGIASDPPLMLKPPPFLRQVLTLRECADLVVGLRVLFLGSPAGRGLSELRFGVLSIFCPHWKLEDVKKIPTQRLATLKFKSDPVGRL